MNGRERLHCILNRQPVDRLSWTTLVDDVTRAGMPPEVKGLSTLDFYRHVGCDILQFGNYGLSEALAVKAPSRLVCPAVTCEIEKEEDGRLVRRIAGGLNVAMGIGGETVAGRVTLRRITPWGTLTTVLNNDHPVEYPVQSLEDVRVLRAIWESADYVEQEGMEDSFARIERLIGGDGMYVPTIDPSPVQYLLEYEMGVANFYYLLSDHPREVRELLAVMHAKRLREYEIVARRTKAEVVIPVENTSSTMISPEVYRELSLPQVRDYVNVLHAHGKKAILHMCGHLHALLPAIRETGLDGINAVTQPPVGSASCEDVLDVCGDDFILFGAVLDPTVFHRPGVSCEELHGALAGLYTPRLRRANMVLWIAVDGLATPLERFQAVGRWMAPAWTTAVT